MENAMSDKIIMRFVFWTFVILGVIVVVASTIWPDFSPPAPWVDPWTTWLATWLGIGVVVRGFWVVGDSAARYFDKKYNNLDS